MFKIKVLLQPSARKPYFLAKLPLTLFVKRSCSWFPFIAMLIFIQPKNNCRKKTEMISSEMKIPQFENGNTRKGGNFDRDLRRFSKVKSWVLRRKKGDEQSLHTSSKKWGMEKKERKKRIMSIVSRSKSISRFRTSRERKFFDHGYQTIRIESLIT